MAFFGQKSVEPSFRNCCRLSAGHCRAAGHAEDSLLAETDFSSAGTENEAAEEENVTVIDSARLDVDLIEQKLNPAAAEVARQAEASIVEVYPNGDGILTAPEVEQTPLLSLHGK